MQFLHLSPGWVAPVKQRLSHIPEGFTQTAGGLVPGEGQEMIPSILQFDMSHLENIPVQTEVTVLLEREFLEPKHTL